MKHLWHRLSPNNINAYTHRARGRFYLGQFSAAQEDLEKSLDLAPADPFLAIWYYLAGARFGLDGKQDLEKNLEKVQHRGLSEKIALLFLGKLSPGDLLIATKDSDAGEEKENICEANFYLGEYALLQGNPVEALKFFRVSLDTGLTHFVEYTASRAEIDRLEK